MIDERRRRGLVLVLAGMVFFAAAVTSVHRAPPGRGDYQGICVNLTQAQHLRLPDRDCDPRHGGPGMRVYYRAGTTYPGVGQDMYTFDAPSFQVPPGHVAAPSGASRKSGWVTAYSVGQNLRGGWHGWHVG